GRRMIGFNQAGGVNGGDASLAELLPQVTSDDLMEYGMIPEFVGRLPVVTALKPLTETDLVRILNEPKNALVKQYQKLFEMEDAELAFSESALRRIAAKALEKDTGARGLRSIIENIMLDIMFDLPDRGRSQRYMIDEDVVDGHKKLFPMPMHKSA